MNAAGRPIANLTACVAVLGTGGMGMRHLALISKAEGLTSIAVPKRPERALVLSESGLATAKDLKQAHAMGATACIIATDTGQHLQDGLTAIGNGLDVLMEKPLATNGPDAGLLRNRAAEAGRKLFVGCDLRFSESMNTFRDLLPTVGRLHSVRIECQSYYPDWRQDRGYQESFRARAGEGGVLLDLIHEIDYAGWLYGWPTAVHGRVKNLGRLGIDADETADLSWETSGGYVVSLSVDFLSRPPRRQMRAYGEHGTLEWDGVEGTVTSMITGDQANQIRSTQTYEEAYLAQAQAFINACNGNREPHLVTADDGVRALAVCDAARRSTQSKREEKVEVP